MFGSLHRSFGFVFDTLQVWIERALGYLNVAIV